MIEQRAKGKLGEVLAKAQGESVSRAAAADHKPFEFEVHVDGELAGIYKGNSAENLERSIKYFMGEAGMAGDVRVSALTEPTAPAAQEASEQAPNAAGGTDTAPPPPPPTTTNTAPRPPEPDARQPEAADASSHG